MRISIKDETFEKIYNKFEEIEDKEMLDILTNAKVKYEESNTENKKDGAKKTAAINAAKKKNLVKVVYEKYIFENKKINAAQIAKAAGVAYNTTTKYLKELQQK